MSVIDTGNSTCRHSKNPINLVIVTDSRGRGLDYELAFSPRACNCVETYTKVCPGAKLSKLVEEAREIDSQLRSRGEKADYTVIAGGICSFTRKAPLPHPGARSLVYDTKQDCVSEIKSEIDRVRRTLGDQVSVATIPPASLIKYYQFMNGKPPTGAFLHALERQQAKLLNDIENVNRYIINDNIRTRVETIDWDRKVHSHSLKKRTKGKSTFRKRVIRFTDKDLYDGVHANTKLQDQWFTRCVEVIYKELKKLFSSQTSSKQVEESNASDDEMPIRLQWDTTTKKYKVKD